MAIYRIGSWFRSRFSYSITYSCDRLFQCRLSLNRVYLTLRKVEYKAP